MKPTVQYKEPKGNEKVVQVKNLRWLLKHWKEVDHFNLYHFGRFPQDEGLMIAHMVKNSKYLTYRCTWASFNLMVEWLNRPVFRGIGINIDKEEEE